MLILKTSALQMRMDGLNNVISDESQGSVSSIINELLKWDEEDEDKDNEF